MPMARTSSATLRTSASISVDPTNGNKMTIGWRQFNDVTSNFRQGGWGYTTDGGMTWTFPGVLENNVFRSDPVTKSDEIGKFFYLSLQSNVNSHFFATTCGARRTAANPGRCSPAKRGAGGGDKQWFTIDKTNGPGHGFQYQSDDGINCSGSGVQFQRSTNGGVTWQAPINIPNAPIYGTLDVDTNGNRLCRRRREHLLLRSLEQCAESGARHQLLTEAPRSTWVATSVSGGINRSRT